MEIKLGEKVYNVNQISKMNVDGNTIDKGILDHIHILFNLEFNYLGECDCTHKGFDPKFEKKCVFKHSSNNYYVLFHKVTNSILLQLFYRYKKDTYLMHKCEFTDETFTLDNVYHKLIFPYVLQYHMVKEHYKRLHLKILDRTVRRILECRFMKSITDFITSLLEGTELVEYEGMKNTETSIKPYILQNKDFNYYILIDKYNPFINHIEYNYTEKDYANMDAWKSYYD